MSTTVKKKAAAKKSVEKSVEKPVEKSVKEEVSKKKVIKKKVASTKKAATKKVVKKATKKSTKPSRLDITAEERWKMVAVAAYHKAEKRNFEAGHELEDWTESEKEIDAFLRG